MVNQEDLENLRESENKKRNEENKQVCSFISDSSIRFEQLLNYTDKLGEKIHPDVIRFMHLIMDECTHLLNYEKPVDASLIKIITAKEDCYILRDGVNDFNSIWPGVEVEYLDKGHVSAFLLSQNQFRQTIISMLNKLIQKHYSPLSN